MRSFTPVKKQTDMKKILALLLCITLGTAAMAQMQAKDEKAVTDVVEKLRKAMVDGDSTVLADIAADDLTYGHSGGHVEGKAEFVHKIASGNSDFITIDLSEQTIKVLGSTAVVRHKLVAQTHDKGKEPGTVTLGILLVFQKQKGQWKLLARQAVKLNK